MRARRYKRVGMRLRGVRHFAHTLSGTPREKWEPLAVHLAEVADLAATLAERAGISDGATRGRLAGWLHDLGKYLPAFQAYLESSAAGASGTRVSHKLLGAAHAYSLEAPDVAAAIAGHHGGLPDWSDLRDQVRRVDGLQEILSTAEAELPAMAAQRLPAELRTDTLAMDLHTRLLFSCLVDADFLCTEAFMDGRRALARPEHALDPEGLLGHLHAHLAGLPTTGDVNRWRAEVLQACLGAGSEPPGIFSLTVPTGGGKTLASMAFALEHARRHAMRRIIYVIPYLSIIEQNAEVFRRALGEGAVLEHHSLAGFGGDDGDDPDPKRLAAENWDYPVVVTTSVQFFESLFAARPSACRKLHNIPGSIVVFDECQTLPQGLLEPILDMLRRLVRDYGVTAVLCTATQPALGESDSLPCGLPSVREIIPFAPGLFQALHRTRVSWPRPDEQMSWLQVAETMERAPEGQALCITNTIDQARELFSVLRDRGNTEALHLSTHMCPAHRLDRLAAIRDRLSRGQRCLVASTQLVEAGVDLDFPMVLRALGPLDSIAQAAGRCNREGNRDVGEVIVFRPEDDREPPGWYAEGRRVTESALAQGKADIHDPGTFRAYFQSLYGLGDLDAHRIQDLRRRLEFAEVASRFRMIDTHQLPVVVDYRSGGRRDEGPGALLDAAVERGRLSRDHVRQLQRFMVNVPHYRFERMLRQSLIDEILPGLHVWAGPYDPDYGLNEGDRDPLIL